MADHPVIKALQPYLERGCADARLVLELGRPFQASALPDGWNLGEPTRCFVNAADAAFNRRGVYVEGFAISSVIALPMHHAWVTKDGRTAIDVTWQAAGAAYYGIPVPTAFLIQVVTEHNKRPSILAHADNPQMVKRLRQALRLASASGRA